jgi:hypothetical protein
MACPLGARVLQDAMTSMNGQHLGGRTITCELSGRPPRGERPQRGGHDDYRADTRGAFNGSGGGNSRSSHSSEIATKNLFVANIPETLSEGDVEQHFGK